MALTGLTILTLALALAMGLGFAMTAGGPSGLAGDPGSVGKIGGGGGGVISPTFVTVACGAFGLTWRTRWKLTRRPGRKRGIARQRWRPMRRNLRSALTKVIWRGIRSQARRLRAARRPRLRTEIR